MNRFISKIKFFAYTLDLREIALLKLTSVCLGILIGLSVAAKNKKLFAFASIIGFFAAALPLATRFANEYADYELDDDDELEVFDDDCFETIE